MISEIEKINNTSENTESSEVSKIDILRRVVALSERALCVCLFHVDMVEKYESSLSQVYVEQVKISGDESVSVNWCTQLFRYKILILFV